LLILANKSVILNAKVLIVSDMQIKENKVIASQIWYAQFPLLLIIWIKLYRF